MTSAAAVALDERPYAPGAVQCTRAMCTCSYTLNGAAAIQNRCNELVSSDSRDIAEQIFSTFLLSASGRREKYKLPRLPTSAFPPDLPVQQLDHSKFHSDINHVRIELLFLSKLALFFSLDLPVLIKALNRNSRRGSTVYLTELLSNCRSNAGKESPRI